MLGRVGIIAALMVAAVACTASPSTTPADSSPSQSPAASENLQPATPHPFADVDSWIAYQTDRGGEGVWLIRPDGSEDHEVATDVPGQRLHPDWSPDGSHLLLTSRGAKDLVYELDVESGEARQLWDCADPCVGDDEAVYSPDGTQIAFIRALGPIEGGMPSDCALWLGDPATGAVQPLTTTPGCSHRETFPHWSRDGTSLAYYRGVYEPGGVTTSTALYVLSLETGQELKLTDDATFAGDSDWSQGDEWLVFSTYPFNDFQCCEVSNLYRIHPDGTGLEQLTHYETDALRATQPRYTPAGEWIVFTAVSSSSRELWVMPAEGGEPIVVKAGGIHTHGTWQP